MPVKRLSELLGVPRSTNWTHISGTGELVCIIKRGKETILIATRAGKRILPIALFAEFYEVLLPGGCLAQPVANDRWSCPGCKASWRQGEKLPRCEQWWRNPPPTPKEKRKLRDPVARLTRRKRKAA